MNRILCFSTLGIMAVVTSFGPASMAASRYSAPIADPVVEGYARVATTDVRAPRRPPSANHDALKNVAQNAKPTKCDTLAAHPWDPHKLTEGVYWNQVPPARALPACRAAVRNDYSARNMFQYARALAKSKEYVEAAKWYHKAGELGYVQAQYALGDIYEFGEGVELNYSLAQRWYKKAASQGYIHASAKLTRLKSAVVTNIRQQMVTANPISDSTR
jgi:hypothetical protein